MSSSDLQGRPNFIWAVGQVPAEPADDARRAAERHLARFAKAHDLDDGDLDTARLLQLRSLRARAYLAKFGQRHQGVEVYPSSAAVLMRNNLDLVAVSGHLAPLDVAKGKDRFLLTPGQALAGAVQEELDLPLDPEQVLELPERNGDYRRFKLAVGVRDIHLGENHVKPIWYAASGKLEAAYFAEFYAGQFDDLDSVAMRYIVSATNGETLAKRSLTQYEAFSYRVWADSTAPFTPLDSPTVDWSPHPTGVRDGTIPTSFVPPVLITIDGFNTSPLGTFDSWLATGAVESRGNNVDAYTDHDLPDGYSNADIRATTNGVRTFDRTFDTAADPLLNEDQMMASVTSLFYVNNWLHDYYYDSGFDELAGNAQESNYGRGGLDHDVLRAEAQDNALRGNRNNANMSTPSDGLSPRMQMYNWTGLETISLDFTPGGNVPAGTAAFGARNFDITAQVVAATDGVGNPNDGCSPITNSVAGRIALLDRGSCTFTAKAQAAQAAGAVALIIANNNASTTPPGLGGADPSITIGLLSVTQAAGAALRASLAQGAVTAHMLRNVSADRDGSLDQQVVAHEWGHYFHHRLTDCGLNQCRSMSEGWGDWSALFMSLRAGDALDAVYPAAVYATLSFANGGYYGIRRYPYSTDRNVNGLTFAHVEDGVTLPGVPGGGGPNSEVHNAGEVWASALWEMYTGLHREAASSTTAVSFAEVQRRMADYMVAGLLMTPTEGSFTEGRDGILAAVAAMSRQDLAIAASAFASRGFGSCAVSPPIDSANFAGVVEHTSIAPRITLGRITLDESLRSCDDDGYLDGDEAGYVTIDVGNASPAAATGVTLTVSSTSAGVTFPGGAAVSLGTIDPFGTKQVQVEVALAASLTGLGSLVLGVAVHATAACEPTLTSTVITRVNTDSQTGAQSDDVESDVSAWARTGDGADEIWTRAAGTALDRAWFGLDAPRVTDTSLESPDLQVNTSTTFAITFDHRYSFEADTIFWDGGVIELSTDGGATWRDLSNWTAPGYGGALTDTSGNPLALRQAFVADNASWPARDTVRYDLGTQLAGQTVRVRFRIGTDASAAAYGWEIDNLRFQGILNAPFTQIVPDAAICPIPLVASAGPDQTVDPGDTVALDGTGSVSSENLPFTYAWSQTAGTPVSMFGGNGASPVFTAPKIGAGQTLTFLLTVNDGTRTATDAVDIVVRPSAPLVPDAGPDQTVEARQVVILDATGSQADLPLSYGWVQSAGPAVTLSSGTAPIVRFEAPSLTEDATLRFTLTIADGTRTATDSVDILVHAVPALVADAGPDLTVNQNVPVALDGSHSRSEGNLPISYSWSQTGGPAVDLGNASGPIATFTSPEIPEGSMLSFVLTVSDGTRTASDAVDVTVRPFAAPTLTADAGPDQAVEGDTTVLLDGTGSRSGGNRPLSYHWALKSGALPITLKNESSAVATFEAPVTEKSATLVFELTVEDGIQSATDTVEVRVKATPRGKKEDGCSCSSAPRTDSSAALGLLLLGAGLALRRRRAR